MPTLIPAGDIVLFLLEFAGVIGAPLLAEEGIGALAHELEKGIGSGSVEQFAAMRLVKEPRDPAGGGIELKAVVCRLDETHHLPVGGLFQGIQAARRALVHDLSLLQGGVRLRRAQLPKGDESVAVWRQLHRTVKRRRGGLICAGIPAEAGGAQAFAFRAPGLRDAHELPHRPAAEIEHGDPLLAVRVRRIAGKGLEAVDQQILGELVALPGMVILDGGLGLGEIVVRVHRVEGAPGVFVEEVELAPGRGGEAGVMRGGCRRQRFEQIGLEEFLFGAARDASDIGGAGAAEIPVIGPVAAQEFVLIARLKFDAFEQLIGGDEADPGLEAAGVPLADQPGDLEVGGRVVPADRRGRGGQIDEIVGVGHGLEMLQVVRQPLLHPLDRVLPGIEELVEHGIVSAVHDQDLAAGGALPAEDRGAFGDWPAEVDVDRHNEQLDAGIGEEVDGTPGDAVDVVLVGGTDIGAEEQAHFFDRLELLDELLGGAEGGGIELEAGESDAALSDEALEAGDGLLVGALEPFLHLGGHLDGPFGGRGLVPGGRGLEQLQGLIDEFAVQLPDDGLGVGVADIEVAVVDDEDLFDFHYGTGLVS